jgi:hypothetical protein
MRSFCSSVIGSMLSASFIHFCRRISDANILLNFPLKIIFCASNFHTGAVFFIAAGKRLDVVVDPRQHEIVLFTPDSGLTVN